MAHIKILENASEIGAGTRGPGLGIEALRYAAIKKKSNLFSSYDISAIEHYNDELSRPSEFSNAWYIDRIVEVYKNVCQKVSETLENGSFPVVLAGDHSSAGGTIAGIKHRYPNKRLGVIWIDAHADLHSPYTTPSGNVHGMPLASALAEDNLESAVNQPDDRCVSFWNELKTTGGISPKILPSDIVFFGVRDTEAPEESLMDKFSIPNFTVAQCRESGISSCVKQAIHHLEACDLIYISFDVDSMDSVLVSNGTGTPVPDGFTEDEALDIIRSIINETDKVCAFEMVEINPLLDHHGNKMAEISLDILEKVLPEL